MAGPATVPATRFRLACVSLDMPEQCFPMRSLRASHVAQIAPHHVTPAARWVERIVLIVPQQHMDVRNRHLVPGLALILHTPWHTLEVSLEAAQFVG